LGWQDNNRLAAVVWAGVGQVGQVRQVRSEKYPTALPTIHRKNNSLTAGCTQSLSEDVPIKHPVLDSFLDVMRRDFVELLQIRNRARYSDHFVMRSRRES